MYLAILKGHKEREKAYVRDIRRVILENDTDSRVVAKVVDIPLRGVISCVSLVSEEQQWVVEVGPEGLPIHVPNEIPGCVESLLNLDGPDDIRVRVGDHREQWNSFSQIVLFRGISAC